jgi:hypothetical protein
VVAVVRCGRAPGRKGWSKRALPSCISDRGRATSVSLRAPSLSPQRSVVDCCHWCVQQPHRSSNMKLKSEEDARAKAGTVHHENILGTPCGVYASMTPPPGQRNVSRALHDAVQVRPLVHSISANDELTRGRRERRPFCQVQRVKSRGKDRRSEVC